MRFNPCVSRASFGDLNFQEFVFLGTPKGQSRHPVLATQRFLRLRSLLTRKQPRFAGKLRPGNFATHGAWRNFDLRIVPNAFVFSRVVRGLNKEFAVLLSEPDRSVNCRSALTKRC